MKQTFLIIGNNIKPFTTLKEIIEYVNSCILYAFNVVYDIQNKLEFYEGLLNYTITRKSLQKIGTITLLNNDHVQIWIKTIDNTIHSKVIQEKHTKHFFNDKLISISIKNDILEDCLKDLKL